MKKHLFYFFLMLISLTGCNAAKANPEAEEVEEGLPVINLSENVKEVSTLNLSDAVEKVEIVKLETTDKSLIRRVDKIEVTENDIFIQNGLTNILHFSRDGKFLNTIGKVGQGPAEYPQLGDYIVDDSRKEVYIISFTTGIQVYDYEGNHLRREYKQSVSRLFSTGYYEMFRYDNTWMSKQNTTVLDGMISNPKDSLWSFAVFDDEFNKQYLFKNPAHIGREEEIVNHGYNNTEMWPNPWWENTTVFDLYNDELTIKFPDTDSIYIYKDKALEPLYAIETNEEKGDYGLTHEMYKLRRAFNYFDLVNYYRSKDYIYLIGNKDEIIYTYAYSIKDHSVRLWKRQGEIEASGMQRMIDAIGRDFLNLRCNFILANDLNGGSFYARYRSQGKCWIYPLQPDTEDYEKYVEELKKSPDAPQKQQLLDVIANTGEEDNPILLIAVLE
ncbi:MAG: 6-bladed beta-propeller [Bacteroidaceae bacterium]|nr:6-bladed beta-propeller [Bacteroidaceae bacterium]